MLDLQFLYSSLTSLARDRGWEQGGGKSFRQQEWLRRSCIDLHEDSSSTLPLFKEMGDKQMPRSTNPTVLQRRDRAAGHRPGLCQPPPRPRKGHSPTALRIRVCSVPPSSRAVSFSTLKEAVCLSLARSGFTLPGTEPCEYLLVSSRAILEAALLCRGTELLLTLALSVDA